MRIIFQGGFYEKRISKYQNLKILKTNDLKNILGIGRDKAYALMRSEAFPSTKIGRTCFVTEKNLEIWLDNYAGREFEL